MATSVIHNVGAHRAAHVLTSTAVTALLEGVQTLKQQLLQIDRDFSSDQERRTLLRTRLQATLVTLDRLEALSQPAT